MEQLAHPAALDSPAVILRLAAQVAVQVRRNPARDFWIGIAERPARDHLLSVAVSRS